MKPMFTRADITIDERREMVTCKNTGTDVSVSRGLLVSRGLETSRGPRGIMQNSRQFQLYLDQLAILGNRKSHNAPRSPIYRS